MRKLLWIIPASLVLIALLILVSVAGLHVFLMTERGERFALDTINSSLPGKISSGSVSISLLGQRVELGDAVLLGPDGRVILATKTIGAELDLPSLLKNRIVITSVSASMPRVMLEMSEDGTLNIVRAFVEEEQDPEEPESDYEVILKSIAIDNGALRYEDSRESLLISLSGVNIRSAIDFSESSAKLEAAIGDALVTMDGSSVTLDRTSLQASLQDGKLDPLFIETNTGDFHATVKGTVRDLFDKPAPDITLDSDGDISDLAAIFGAEKRFTGVLTGRVSLKGTLDNPYGSVDARYSGGLIAGLPVDRGEAAFELSDRVLTLHGASAHLASGNAALNGTIDLKKTFPEGFLLSRPDPDDVTFRLTASAAGLDLTRIFPGEEDYPKSLTGSAVVTGKGISLPDISAETSYELTMKGAFPDSPVRTDTVMVKGRAVLDYPTLRLASTRIATPGMNAQVRGTLDLAARTLRTVVSLNADRMEEAFARPLEKISGSLAGIARISGSFENPNISASVKGRNVEWQEYLLGDVAMDASLDEKGWIRIAELGVYNGEPVLAAEGRAKVFRDGFSLDPEMPLFLDARIRSSNLKRLVPREGLKGGVEADLHLEGSLFDPSGSMALNATGIGYDDLELGDISLDASISEGIASIDRLDLRNRESALQASGRIHILDTKNRRIMPDPQVNLAASGTGVRIEDFGFLAQGIFSVHAKIEGSVKDPQGVVLINGAHLSVMDQNFEKVGIYSVFANRKLSINTFDIVVKGDQKILGSGWIDLDGSRQYEFALSSSGIRFDSFPALKDYRITGGRAVFDLSGNGTMDNPQAKGTIRFIDLAMSGERLEDVSFDLAMSDWKLNMTGRNGFGFRGEYDIRTSDILFQAFFDRTQLDPYFALAGRPDLNGLLTGTAELRGNAEAIEDIDVTLDITQVGISLDTISLISASKLAVWYHDRQLSIPASRLTLLSRGNMTVQAATSRNGRLDLVAQGMVPMGVMAIFDPELAGLEGEVRFRLSAEGPVMEPVINGDVELSHVQYILSYNNQSLHDVSGHIRITPELLTVESLAGQLDTGYFTARGSVGLKDLTPVEVNLTAKARSLPVVIPDSMDLLIETDVSLTGTPDNSLLQGNVTVLDGLYYKDLQLNLIAEVGELIRGGRRPAEAPVEPIQAPFLRNLSLDLTVTRRGSVLIENNLADLTVSPDLQIVGTLNDPVVTGRVSVTEGTVTYQKREFSVTRGVVDFTNPYRTEAEVDLRAEGRIRQWDIILAVSGPLDNLNIDLSSNPPAEDAVILSLLATGRTPDEISGGTGAVQRSPSSMLAEVLANTYGERVRESTGLDILEFETRGPLQGQEGEDIRITVGQELTRRLTLKYSLETESNVVTQTAIAEFKFFENLVVNGFQNTKGGFGGDLQFRAEFR